ncbi:MAG TPA: hypothetical protein DEP85_06185 [Holosporales bacterium]|nr:hypothetical protein [Holosporales bacterium]
MFFKKNCPKCGGSQINVVKETFIEDFKRSLFNLILPIRFFTGHAKKPKNLNVCTSCGFSWEDR